MVKKKCSSDEHAQKLRVIWVFEALESENKNYMTAVAHGAHNQARALPSIPYALHRQTKCHAESPMLLLIVIFRSCFFYLDHAIVPRQRDFAFVGRLVLRFRVILENYLYEFNSCFYELR